MDLEESDQIQRMIWALPLLPAQLFSAGIDAVAVEAGELGLDRYHLYDRYLRRTWLTTAEIVSTWGCPVRTNNISEGFNRHLISKLGGGHKRPRMSHFNRQLKNLLEHEVIAYDKLDNGVPQSERRRASSFVKSRHIVQRQENLVETSWDVKTFLKSVFGPKPSVVQDLIVSSIGSVNIDDVAEEIPADRPAQPTHERLGMEIPEVQAPWKGDRHKRLAAAAASLPGPSCNNNVDNGDDDDDDDDDESSSSSSSSSSDEEIRPTTRAKRAKRGVIVHRVEISSSEKDDDDGDDDDDGGDDGDVHRADVLSNENDNKNDDEDDDADDDDEGNEGDGSSINTRPITTSTGDIADDEGDERDGGSINTRPITTSTGDIADDEDDEGDDGSTHSRPITILSVGMADDESDEGDGGSINSRPITTSSVGLADDDTTMLEQDGICSAETLVEMDCDEESPIISDDRLLEFPILTVPSDRASEYQGEAPISRVITISRLNADEVGCQSFMGNIDIERGTNSQPMLENAIEDAPLDLTMNKFCLSLRRLSG